MNIPSVPPFGNGPIAGPPTAARPEFGQAAPVQAEVREPGFMRRNMAPIIAGLALTGLAAGAVAYVGGEGSQPEQARTVSANLNERSTTTTSEAADQNEKAADIDCEVFPNGPFEASRDEVKLLPTDLHWQPARGERLETTQDVLGFFVDDSGDATACRSAATAGTLLYAAAVIEGIGSLEARELPAHINIQGMIDHIQKLSPEKQSQVIAAIAGMLNKVALNESEIGGIWNKAGSTVTKAEDGTESVKSIMSRVDLNGDPIDVGTVFVISWAGPNGDDLNTNAGANYQILIDQAGQIYFPEALFPTTSETTTTTTTTTSTTTTTTPEGEKQNNGGGSKSNKKTGKKGSKNGGGGSTGTNQGSAGTGGAAGPDGQNPEAGPGGTTDSPANGGGTGPGPGNGVGNPGTPNTPQTPSTPSSPPTTRYKGPEVTIPGAPN